MSIRILSHYLFILILCMGAAGCTVRDTSTLKTGPATQTVGTSWEGDALLAGSFNAADGLAVNMKQRMPEGTRILAATFVNRENFEETSPLGRLVASQVVSRLVQSGFDVVEIRLRSEIGVREGMGEFALTRQTARLMQQKFDAEALLVGCYTVDSRNVFLASRVVRLQDGVQISAFDWALPNDGVVARLLAPEDSGELFEHHLRAPLGDTAMMQKPTRMSAPQPLQEVRMPKENMKPGSAPTSGEIFRLFPPKRMNP